jgi:hypothetical protein
MLRLLTKVKQELGPPLRLIHLGVVRQWALRLDAAAEVQLSPPALLAASASTPALQAGFQGVNGAQI